jgi:D-alanine-D-alanine ligase
MKIRVGVIFGGESVEHEISIITAIQAMNKMDEEKYEIIPIYITKNREWYTGEMLKDIDVYQDFIIYPDDPVFDIIPWQPQDD